MKAKILYLLILSFFTLGCGSSPVQNSALWSKVLITQEVNDTLTDLGFSSSKYSVYILNESSLNRTLNTIKLIKIPTPSGKMLSVNLTDANTLSPELAAKFPMIKTFKAKAVNRPAVFGNLGINTLGFHAMLFFENGHRMFIDKRIVNGKHYYVSYFDKDYHPRGKPNIVESKTFRKN